MQITCKCNIHVFYWEDMDAVVHQSFHHLFSMFRMECAFFFLHTDVWWREFTQKKKKTQIIGTALSSHLRSPLTRQGMWLITVVIILLSWDFRPHTLQASYQALHSTSHHTTINHCSFLLNWYSPFCIEEKIYLLFLNCRLHSVPKSLV